MRDGGALAISGGRPHVRSRRSESFVRACIADGLRPPSLTAAAARPLACGRGSGAASPLSRRKAAAVLHRPRWVFLDSDADEGRGEDEGEHFGEVSGDLPEEAEPLHMHAGTFPRDAEVEGENVHVTLQGELVPLPAQQPADCTVVYSVPTGPLVLDLASLVQAALQRQHDGRAIRRCRVGGMRSQVEQQCDGGFIVV